MVAVAELELGPLAPPVLAGIRLITPRVSVFTAGLDNYTQFRIPALLVVPSLPTPANGCAAGGAGTLLAFAEGRGRGHTSAADWGNKQVVLRTSTDGGRNWGSVSVVVPNVWVAPKSPLNTWTGTYTAAAPPHTSFRHCFV